MRFTLHKYWSILFIPWFLILAWSTNLNYFLENLFIFTVITLLLIVLILVYLIVRNKIFTKYFVSNILIAGLIIFLSIYLSRSNYKNSMEKNYIEEGYFSSVGKVIGVYNCGEYDLFNIHKLATQNYIITTLKDSSEIIQEFNKKNTKLLERRVQFFFIHEDSLNSTIIKKNCDKDVNMNSIVVLKYPKYAPKLKSFQQSR